MTAMQYSGGHMSQQIHKASKDKTEVSRSEGFLRVCDRMKSLRSENAVLQQEIQTT